MGMGLGGELLFVLFPFSFVSLFMIRYPLPPVLDVYSSG
jgi:hypothetical protein